MKSFKFIASCSKCALSVVGIAQTEACGYLQLGTIGLSEAIYIYLLQVFSEFLIH